MIGITTLWIHFLTVIVDAKQTFCYNTHMGATKTVGGLSLASEGIVTL